ncbi:hypothetical protein T07_2182 [Trichinella nelsoni]|uniref:Uncharacterized protein n=1 Tax=Trichinella nelsoni TaxID=6336 RepID=A0A0V0SAQ9_9BILA|nr:hypothetical protein T07_2182 [Trichinella nelsoni]
MATNLLERVQFSYHLAIFELVIAVYQRKVVKQYDSNLPLTCLNYAVDEQPSVMSTSWKKVEPNAILSLATPTLENRHFRLLISPQFL